MLRLKGYLIGSLVVVVLAVLVACDGAKIAPSATLDTEPTAVEPATSEENTSPTVEPTAASARTIELDFWYALGGTAGEAVEALVEQFNASQSSIKVTPTYQGGYAQMMAKMWNAIYAEQTLPHVAHAGAAPLLGATGAIIPITDLTDGPSGIDRSLIRDAFWDYNSAGGQIWTMPFNNSIPVLYYNRDLFAAAGLDPDRPPTTWEEVVEFGKKLTQDTDGNGQIDQWGLNFHDDTHWYLSAMFLENGAQIINAEETQVLYNSPEAVEMLQLWGDMVKTHKIMPPGQHAEARGDFFAGKTGMLLRSSSSIPSALEEATFDLGVANLPTVAGRDPVAPIGGASLAISKNDDPAVVAACWEFVKFMTSRESSFYLSTQTGYLPIYRDALEWPEMQAYLEDHPAQRVAIEGLDYGYAIPIFSALGTSDGALRRAVEAVELGAATPQEALDEAKTVVDKNIAENH